MAQSPSSTPLRRNYWAIVSLVSGTLRFLLALTAPIPFVPIISIFNWPLGLLAILTAWVARRQTPALAPTDPASFRTRWGIRLGCAGWIFQFIVSTIKVIIIAGFLSYFFGTAINSWLTAVTPTPTP